jgi:predicted enzyme related to lactoylglutathione lyase
MNMKAFRKTNIDPLFRICCGWVLFFTMVLVLHGCASIKTQPLPPINAERTNTYHEGKVVWHDLLTEDIAVAKAFYSGLFGWEIQPSRASSDYLIILNKAKPIGGITLHANPDPVVFESIWLVTLSVTDVDDAIATTQQFKGRVLDGPFDAKGRGRMVIVEDPLGAPLVLLRSSTGDPADDQPVSGEWLWTDFFTRDIEKASAFYTALVGYEFRDLRGEDEYNYHLFSKGKHPRAGLVAHAWETVEANWLPYVAVDDIDAVIDKARTLGGKLIAQKGGVAILMDPSGAAFGIQSR